MIHTMIKPQLSTCNKNITFIHSKIKQMAHQMTRVLVMREVEYVKTVQL